MYKIINVGKVLEQSLVKLKLPNHAVMTSDGLKAIDTSTCTLMEASIYLCNAVFHFRNDTCLPNISSCAYEAKRFEGTHYEAGSFGYAIASTQRCKVVSMNGTKELAELD